MSKIKNEQELAQYLDQHEEQLEQLSTQIGELSFQRYLDKKPNPQLVELQKRRGRMSLDPDFHRTMAEWKDRVEEPTLRRRVEVWNLQCLQSKVTAHPEVMGLVQKIDDVIVSHKYKFGNDRIELGQVRNMIKADPNQENRKLAWQAYQELSELVEQDMLELFKLRNKLAQELGYETYVDLVLHGAGMTKKEVKAILTQLTDETQSHYQDIIAQGAQKLGLQTIQPWDVQFILDQQAGDTAQAFPRDKLQDSVHAWAEEMGYDLKALGFEMVFTDIPYNGLCMSIGKNNVKVLGNPKDGYSYYRTSFHEMGHALHGLLKNEQLHYGLRREPSVFNEGMAETFGYITHHPAWIKSFGLGDEEVKQILQGAVGPQYFYLRQRTAFCLFEFAAYEALDQDLNKLMAKTEQAIMGVEYDETLRWAANAWYVNFPVYWQNYVLADVIASQIHHALEDKFGSLYDTKEAVEHVVDCYIKNGASIPWQEKIVHGTGHALQADALIKDLIGKE